MRAFFVKGVEMHVPWAVEGLPTLLLYISPVPLPFFFGWLVIFLFSIDQEVHTCVVWCIMHFSNGVRIDHNAAIQQDSPYYTPLSTLPWFRRQGHHI